ncbi:MAG: hypothetical protein JNL07_03225, partial [Rhodospirillales bacterium]|nr:hypothetical protein [Rhodospirillales bacterium]
MEREAVTGRSPSGAAGRARRVVGFGIDASSRDEEDGMAREPGSKLRKIAMASLVPVFVA